MTKKRDDEYGPKPQDVPLLREELPPSPAKKRSGYCKKGKAEHEFELADLWVCKDRIYPKGSASAQCYLIGLIHWKIYRCTVCGKKKRVRDEYKLEEPVLLSKEASA